MMLYSKYFKDNIATTVQVILKKVLYLLYTAWLIKIFIIKIIVKIEIYMHIYQM